MHQVLSLISNSVGITAIGVHDPQVVAACTITDEGDFAAIRAETRLVVPFDTAGQCGGFAATDRYRVDITEHIEHQGVSILANGYIRPGRSGGINADFLCVVLVRTDIPLGFLFRPLCGFVC